MSVNNVIISISPKGTYNIKIEFVNEKKSFKLFKGEDFVMEIQKYTHVFQWSQDERFLACLTENTNTAIYDFLKRKKKILNTYKFVCFEENRLIGREGGVQCTFDVKNLKKEPDIKYYYVFGESKSVIVKFNENRKTFRIFKGNEEVYSDVKCNLENDCEEDLFYYNSEDEILIHGTGNTISFFHIRDTYKGDKIYRFDSICRRDISPDNKFILVTTCDSKSFLVNSEMKYSLDICISEQERMLSWQTIHIDILNMILYTYGYIYNYVTQRYSDKKYISYCLDTCFVEKYKKEIVNGLLSESSTLKNFYNDNLFDKHLIREIVSFLKY